MDNTDIKMLESVHERDDNKTPWQDFYLETFGIKLSETEARKRLYGIKNYIAYKMDNDLLENENENEETLSALAKIKKQLQKSQDVLRIERKMFREDNRRLNALECLNEELIDVIKKRSENIKTVKHEIPNYPAPKGVFHLSDLHGNEQVDIVGNSYNWETLAKRLKKMVYKFTKIQKAMGVKEILIAQTGDLVNSDRRLGEIMTNATNRANAVFILSEILTHVILDLNKDFNISIGCVIGNESRIDQDVYFEEQLASNNFDAMINRLLYKNLENKEGIKFVPMQNSLENIIEINGQNFLLLHGHTIKGSNPTNAISKIKAKYSDLGIHIRFIIFGHIHETNTGSSHSRSGSTVGNNAYSFYGLHLAGRASQNCYVVYEDGTVHSIALDLQRCEGYNSYDFEEELNSYNSKSVEKFKKENGMKIYKV